MNIGLFVILFILTIINVKESEAQFDLTIDCYASPIKIYPVHLQQKAADYKTQCYQAFNNATLRLNAIALQSGTYRQQAVITDLDETILDNHAVPGAFEFFRFAKLKGFSIFYISNRDTTEVLSILKKLVTPKLADAIPSHILFKSNANPIELSRQKIGEIYDVVLLLGDNPNDFIDIFESKSIPARGEAENYESDERELKFIALPNLYLREWENSLFNDTISNTQQKDDISINSITGY